MVVVCASCRLFSVGASAEELDLRNPDWKFDPIPEIMDGKNIADFIDPDILEVCVRQIRRSYAAGLYCQGSPYIRIAPDDNTHIYVPISDQTWILNSVATLRPNLTEPINSAAQKLDALEREEEEKVAAGEYESDDEEYSEDEEIKELAAQIREKKQLLVQEHRMKKAGRVCSDRRFGLGMSVVGRVLKGLVYVFHGAVYMIRGARALKRAHFCEEGI
jgi:hypothetical protein